MEKQNETDVEKTPEFADARVLNDLNGVDRELMQRINTFLRTHVLKVDLSEGRGDGGFGGNKGGLGGGGIGSKNKLKRECSSHSQFSYKLYPLTTLFNHTYRHQSI